MKVFSLPGGMDAAHNWNQARKNYVAANRAYNAAREHNWVALVRMAQANKVVCEMAGPEEAELFLWLESLYGNREEILRAAATNTGACP